MHVIIYKYEIIHDCLSKEDILLFHEISTLLFLLSFYLYNLSHPGSDFGHCRSFPPSSTL